MHHCSWAQYMYLKGQRLRRTLLLLIVVINPPPPESGKEALSDDGLFSPVCLSVAAVAASYELTTVDHWTLSLRSDVRTAQCSRVIRPICVTPIRRVTPAFLDRRTPCEGMASKLYGRRLTSIFRQMWLTTCRILNVLETVLRVTQWTFAMLRQSQHSILVSTVCC